jgi:hypothetical protein
MSNTLSFSELEAQHAELLPARTLMQTGGALSPDPPIRCVRLAGNEDAGAAWLGRCSC